MITSARVNRDYITNDGALVPTEAEFVSRASTCFAAFKVHSKQLRWKYLSARVFGQALKIQRALFKYNTVIGADGDEGDRGELREICRK